MDRLNAITGESAPALRGREFLTAAAFYSIVAAAFFLPVVDRLYTALIGDGGDGPAFVWNIWWIRQSLFEGRNPLFCDVVFAPTGAPLIWHTLMPLPTTAMAILHHWMPVELAYNLIVMAAFPIAGICAYLLGRYVTGDHAAALVGGLVLMLSPYMASKTLGHPNLLFAGLLPLYLLLLLQATDPDSGPPGWKIRFQLLLASGCLLFSSIVAVVFAANLTAFVFLWRLRSLGGWKRAMRRASQALGPTLLLGAAYGIFVGAVAIAWRFPPHSRMDLTYCPEPLAYLLPLNLTSVWSDTVGALGSPKLGTIELACYLGLFVFPLSLVGLWMGRRNPVVRFSAFCLLVFLMLSMGPKLQLDREVVRVGSMTVYLPYGIWRYIPVLGSVGQTGRYMVIGYLMMGVGVTCLVAAVRRRYGGRVGWMLAIACAALICADYAFRPWITPLPPLACVSDRPGRVLDPRIGNAPSMYYQTAHGKPLIGGYLARVPSRLVESYREDPGIGWLFVRSERPWPNRETFLHSVEELEITDILMDPDDERGAELERFGLEEIYSDRWVVVRAVPTRGNKD